MRYKVIVANFKNPEERYTEEVEATDAISAIHIAERNHPGCIGIEANIQ